MTTSTRTSGPAVPSARGCSRRSSARSPSRRKSGRFVLEVEEEGEWRRAGVMGFDVANERSRIANLGGLAVDPEFRGRRLADEAARVLQRHLLVDLDYHRLQLEIYGFNERAIQHAERAGFIREGVKRKAYWRHEEWVDGVLFGLVREDLEPSPSARASGLRRLGHADWRRPRAWGRSRRPRPAAS